MAEEVDKVVQQELTSDPLVNPAPGESQDIEMPDAQPEQAPEEATDPSADKPTDNTTSEKPPAEATKDEVPKKVPEPSSETKEQAVKSAETTETAPSSTAPAPPTDVTATDADKIAEPAPEKVAEAAPEKVDSGTAEKPAEAAAEKPAEKLENPSDSATKEPTAAEDASVKLLAANLEAPVNGGSSDDAKISESPVIGEKRKADDIVEANGADSNKKANVESSPPAPATNGAPQSRKPGRPRKDKKVATPVGRTARRTRSQGAPEA